MAAEGHTAHSTGPCTALRFRAGPTDVNSDGNVRAGGVMRWIDETAYVCGADWAGAEVAMSYLAGIRFYRPIFVGDVIEVSARIIHTGLRSIHMGIQVTTADSQVVADGLVVTVSVDERGDARPVAPWEPVSDEDRRLDQGARRLIELRQFNEPFTISTVDVLRC
jgi:4-hydroxybenzoyl-CoA thioesterase